MQTANDTRNSVKEKSKATSVCGGVGPIRGRGGGPNQRRGRLRRQPGGGRRLGEVRAAAARIRPAAAARCPMNDGAVAEAGDMIDGLGGALVRAMAELGPGGAAAVRMEVTIDGATTGSLGEPATVQRPATERRIWSRAAAATNRCGGSSSRSSGRQP
ncbi:hypothetical protein Syun_007449 [Stephania yunnanensis]|uniref:Uncharacterized protein n=1 Tax=Stephania yunnanensis TaxID=152371 RepID=A0AAP0PYQ3_9MAGN